jgi:hypothetical protein
MKPWCLISAKVMKYLSFRICEVCVCNLQHIRALIFKFQGSISGALFINLVSRRSRKLAVAF